MRLPLFSACLTDFGSSERPRPSAFLRVCPRATIRLSSLADDTPESDSSSDSLDERDTRRLRLAFACSAPFGGSFERLLALRAGSLRPSLRGCDGEPVPSVGAMGSCAIVAYRSRTTRPSPSAWRSRSRPNCINCCTLLRSGDTFSLRIISAAASALMNASRVSAGSYASVAASPVRTSANSASSFHTKWVPSTQQFNSVSVLHTLGHSVTSSNSWVPAPAPESTRPLSSGGGGFLSAFLEGW